MAITKKIVGMNGIHDTMFFSFQIFNEGPGAVNTARVTIDFPYEVANGKWLLYMTEMPFVEDNKGSCNVTPAVYVNELGLKVRSKEQTCSRSFKEKVCDDVGINVICLLHICNKLNSKSTRTFVMSISNAYSLWYIIFVDSLL